MVKTKTAGVILFVLFSFNAISQVSFGIYGGLNLANLAGDKPKDFDYDSKPGLELHSYLEFTIAKDVRISVEPGFDLNRIELVFKDNINQNRRDSIDIKLDFFSVPVIVKVLSDNNKWKFISGLAPQIAINQKADNGQTTIELSDDLINFNLNILFGLEYKISPVWFVQARISQGLYNLSNDKESLTSLVPRVKATSFKIAIGYQLIGKRGTE